MWFICDFFPPFCLSLYILGVLVKDICSTHMVVLPTNILFVNKEQTNSKWEQTVYMKTHSWTCITLLLEQFWNKLPT